MMSGVVPKLFSSAVTAVLLCGCGDGGADVSTSTTSSNGGMSTGGTTATTTSTSPSGPSHVGAFDPLVRYIGRIRDGKGKKYMMMDWNSVQATVRFYGTSLHVELSSPEAEFGSSFIAEIDGVHSEKLTVKGSKKKDFTLAEDLPYGEHVATIWKVSESQQTEDSGSSMHLHGFSLSDGGVFVKPPELKKRKLDIWGASMTAGYCADGPPGPDSQQFSNYNKTWSRQLSLMLNADHMTEAISGVGIAQGVDGTGVFKSFMDSTVMSKDTDWDWSNWAPDAVLMFLGTNDDHKTRVTQKFHKAFAELLEHVVVKYKSVKPKIIHITEPEVCKDTKKDIDAFNTKHGNDGFKAFEVCFSEKAWNSLFSKEGRQFQGCDNHPNLDGGIMLAQDILQRVRDILGWSEFELI